MKRFVYFIFITYIYFLLSHMRSSWEEFLIVVLFLGVKKLLYFITKAVIRMRAGACYVHNWA